MTDRARWLRIGGTMLIGLFIAYIDRSNLSVTLPEINQELGLTPEFSTWLLTIFLIGYAVANFFGGILTMKYDPKYVIMVMVLIWSLGTIWIGFTESAYVVLGCRLLLGLTEGVYWPQQSRFARDWFKDNERSRANSVIQYYGMYLALAFGFLLLIPLNEAVGWRNVFIITGAASIVILIPLFGLALKRRDQSPFYKPEEEAGPKTAGQPKVKLTWEALGGKQSITLLVFAYIAQGFLFWGITLWIPMVVGSFGFEGTARALAASIPYVFAILLAPPLAWFSDKTGKRVKIAAVGLFLPGISMFIMPFVANPYVKIALITFALSFYTASFTPNFWSFLQATVKPHAVGAASGIVAGIGAGGGGTLAGLMVGYLHIATGTYVWGFMIIGVIVLSGSFALMKFSRLHNMP